MIAYFGDLPRGRSDRPPHQALFAARVGLDIKQIAIGQHPRKTAVVAGLCERLALAQRPERHDFRTKLGLQPLLIFPGADALAPALIAEVPGQGFS